MRSTCVHPAAPEGDVEGAAREVFAPEGFGGGGECQHLGMCGDVVQQLGLVVGAGDDGVASHDDGAHGYLAFGCRGASLAEGFAHVEFVGVVEDAHCSFLKGKVRDEGFSRRVIFTVASYPMRLARAAMRRSASSARSMAWRSSKERSSLVLRLRSR